MTETIASLHAAIDEHAAEVARSNGDRLNCKAGCADCCVDDIKVFAVEANRIKEMFPEVLTEAPHAPGKCAFLDNKDQCRVYAARPYVCRTQGLPLAWVTEEEGAWVEHRDICELNAEGPDLVQLPSSSVWPIGPFEGRLAAAAGPEGLRVALRSLFVS